MTDLELHPRIAHAWHEVHTQTPVQAWHLVRDLASLHARFLVEQFYTAMLGDSGAARFLSHQMVEERLAASLQRWLDEVFVGGDAEAINQLVARQIEIGEVHARIGVPAHLVSAGARLIKRALIRFIEESEASIETKWMASSYAWNIMDLAIEAMIAAYSEARERSVQDEAAYRYFAGIRHIGMERERQQSSLLEWQNDVVYQLATGSPAANIPRIADSSFGLWFKHKGQPVFSKDPQASTVRELITRCDQAIDRLREADDPDSQEARTLLLRELHQQSAQIRLLMQSVFEKFMELENGRDELTHLLNRRFLPTVLRREIALAKRGQRPFAVIMIDLDHFKSLNDLHGHATGDLALQSVASVILRNLRISDYAFRYGGEEFLLVLVETNAEAAKATAERLREAIEREPIRLSGGQPITVSASIGVAVHNGHPDYSQIINAADAAVYQAKARGRNCVVMANDF